MMNTYGVFTSIVVTSDWHAVAAACARYRNVRVTAAVLAALDGCALRLVFALEVCAFGARALGADVLEPLGGGLVGFAVVYAHVRWCA